MPLVADADADADAVDVVCRGGVANEARMSKKRIEISLNVLVQSVNEQSDAHSTSSGSSST